MSKHDITRSIDESETLALILQTLKSIDERLGNLEKYLSNIDRNVKGIAQYNGPSEYSRSRMD